MFTLSLVAQAQEPPAPQPQETRPAPPSPEPAPEPAPPPVTAPPPSAPAPEAAPPAQEPSPADNSPLAKDGHPLSGWHSGLFFLRDYNDNFRLYVQGRAQIDMYSYLGPGVSDTNLQTTLFLRRIRPEISGEILGRWQFMIAGDFGATSLDNPTGRNETSAAGPGAAPTAATARYAPTQAVKFGAAPTDVMINYRALDLFNFQVGQFDAPFTMENQTSDKYFPFIERSLAVRVVGEPSNKEIGGMVWGETPNRFWTYEIGLFNGDGQNRLNTDSRGDLLARTFVHPLLGQRDPLSDLQVGASVRYGSRDSKWTYYDYPAMTTQGAYTFWSPVYTGANGVTHVIPSGDQLGVAGELRIPFSIVDLTSEFVYIKNNTREAIDGYQSTNTERFGDMSGYSYYVSFGVWPLGNRDINLKPGYSSRILRVDFSKPDPAIPPRALQLLVKWEQLHLTYSSASRQGTPDSKNIDGDINVNVLELGANYWVTRHLRLSANYLIDMFPASAPTKATTDGGPVQTSAQRAIAPGNTLATGVNDDARDNAHLLHELIFRMAVAL
jgi:phosphate-selective porin